MLKEYTIWIDVHNPIKYGIHTGIGRFIEKVASELLKIRDEINVDIELVTVKNKEIVICKQWSGFKSNKNELKMKKGDVLFLPSNVYDFETMNLLNHVNDGLCIIPFLHDIIPITHPQFCNGSKEFKNWIIDITNLKTGIICNSKFTADSFLEKFNYSYPISCVHLGCDAKEILQYKSLDLPKGKNVLMVSTIEPRKMYDKTIKQFEILWNKRSDINLIIVGKSGWKVDELMRKIETHPKRMSNLFCLSKVSDSELHFLYKNCDLFLFSSEIEGFGLGVVEASRFGIPLLLRDIPVFREIAGDFATYFNDFEKLPDIIEDGFDSGFKRSDDMKVNSWKNTAIGCLTLLNQIRNNYAQNLKEI
jgi:glycosyltransferase involved in cell wall biosynthesis